MVQADKGAASFRSHCRAARGISNSVAAAGPGLAVRALTTFVNVNVYDVPAVEGKTVLFSVSSCATAVVVGYRLSVAFEVSAVHDSRSHQV